MRNGSLTAHNIALDERISDPSEDRDWQVKIGDAKRLWNNVTATWIKECVCIIFTIIVQGTKRNAYINVLISSHRPTTPIPIPPPLVKPPNPPSNQRYPPPSPPNRTVQQNPPSAPTHIQTRQMNLLSVKKRRRFQTIFTGRGRQLNDLTLGRRILGLRAGDA